MIHYYTLLAIERLGFWHTNLLDDILTTIGNVHHFDYNIDIHLERQEKNNA